MKADYIRNIDANATRRCVIQDVTIEKREVEGVEGGKEVIKGYFSVYNTQYKMGSYYPIIETISPGAFAEADLSDVLCLYNHDDDMLLGRLYNGEGTLRIGFDDKGGYFEVDKANTTAWNDTYENIRLKNIRGCSFAFTVAEQAVEYDVQQTDGTMADMVTITKVKKLYDVGPVNNPAYVETDVEASMRSKLDANKPSKRETLEDQLLNIKLQTRK